MNLKSIWQKLTPGARRKIVGTVATGGALVLAHFHLPPDVAQEVVDAVTALTGWILGVY